MARGYRRLFQISCCGICLDAGGFTKEQLIAEAARSRPDELADWTIGPTASSRSDAGYPGRRASREMLMTPQVVVALTAWSDRNR